MRIRLQLALIAGMSVAGALLADATAQTTAVSGTRPARLIIRNAIVVDGNGTPAKGPFDIVVENNTITQTRRARSGGARTATAAAGAHVPTRTPSRSTRPASTCCPD